MMPFYYNYQNALRISFLVQIFIPSENSRTIVTNYLTKENRQSILSCSTGRNRANGLL